MRLALLLAGCCLIVAAQQPQLFESPSAEPRFKSSPPSFTETFSKPSTQPAAQTNRCAVPLLNAPAAATNDRIQRFTPKDSPEPGMPIAKGLPVCGAPAGEPASPAKK